MDKTLLVDFFKRTDFKNITELYFLFSWVI